jgi:hypothetical protein
LLQQLQKVTIDTETRYEEQTSTKAYDPRPNLRPGLISTKIVASKQIHPQCGD